MEQVPRLQQFLTQFHCNSPIFPSFEHGVIRISTEGTLEEAFKKLIDAQILAIPAVDKNGRAMYVLSMMNIMDFFLTKFSESDFKKDFTHKISHFFNPKEEKVSTTPLSTVADTIRTTLDDVWVVDKDAPLFDAVKLMIEKKAHRILVLKDNSAIASLITQSRILNFIGVMIDGIPECSKSIKELNLGSSPVISVDTSHTAYHAFNTMRDKRLSALAVVDSKGALIGDISVSDLKLIGYDMAYWNLLGLPVNEYMNEVRAHPEKHIRSHLLGWIDSKKKNVPLVLTATESDTLGYIIKLMNYYHIHRVFVVDSQFKPLRVISILDILNAIVHL